MLIIGKIVENVPCILPETKSKKVNELFVEDETLRGIVVVHNNQPVGQIPRTHFYQKIGTQYGYNLYMGRESKLLFKNTPLIVDYSLPITDVSTLAMQRPEQDLYDDIIVTKNSEFFGVVSIRALLLHLVEAQAELASFLNPLSHLPGNHLIEQKLQEVLTMPYYSLVYFDVDFFKMYNDMYGFKRGDQVLLYLTEILKGHITQNDYFLGHVGGDDFVAVIPHYDVTTICNSIIHKFDDEIEYFYDKFHLHQELFVTGRSGIPEPFKICSLSVAVVTNEEQHYTSIDCLTEAAARVKKLCKDIPYSCYLINEGTPLDKYLSSQN
ncbi:GGDEF domain-containing protein [Lysinibacillus sp. 54212]|uniref:GGDEF domain-containing protein n=1 Tax=Lysinibacillus sp. 54212 TaxID=3119829 RepID=UPI002FC8CBDD